MGKNDDIMMSVPLFIKYKQFNVDAREPVGKAVEKSAASEQVGIMSAMHVLRSIYKGLKLKDI